MKFDRVYIEITNICNFDCPFCSTSPRPKKEMSLKEFELALNEVKDYTDEVCLHVLGEPLLHRHFDEILQLIEANGLKINLVTNGFYLKDKQDIILQYKQLFKKISVSMHAYKYVNMIGDKLHEILTVSKVLSDNKILVELRNLYSDDTEFDYNSSSNNTSANNFDNNSDNNSSANNFDNQLRAAFVRVFGLQLSGHTNQKIKGYLYYVLKKPFVWPDQSQDMVANVQKSKGIYCLGGRTHIAVLSDLKLVPCCLDSSANLLLGSLATSSLAEILNSKRFKDMYNSFGKSVANEDFCKTCQYNIVKYQKK